MNNRDKLPTIAKDVLDPFEEELEENCFESDSELEDGPAGEEDYDEGFSEAF